MKGFVLVGLSTVALGAAVALLPGNAFAQGFSCTQSFNSIDCQPSTMGVRVYQDPFAASNGAAIGSILNSLSTMQAAPPPAAPTFVQWAPVNAYLPKAKVGCRNLAGLRKGQGAAVDSPQGQTFVNCMVANGYSMQ